VFRRRIVRQIDLGLWRLSGDKETTLKMRLSMPPVTLKMGQLGVERRSLDRANSSKKSGVVMPAFH